MTKHTTNHSTERTADQTISSIDCCSMLWITSWKSSVKRRPV